MDFFKKRSVAFTIAIVTVLLSTWHLFRTYPEEVDENVMTDVQVTEESGVEANRFLYLPHIISFLNENPTREDAQNLGLPMQVPVENGTGNILFGTRGTNYVAYMSITGVTVFDGISVLRPRTEEEMVERDNRIIAHFSENYDIRLVDNSDVPGLVQFRTEGVLVIISTTSRGRLGGSTLINIFIDDQEIEDDQEVNLSDLIGTWVLQESDAVLMSFHEDGTIFYTFGDEEWVFEWEIFTTTFPDMRFDGINLIFNFEDGSEQIYIRQSYEPQNLAVGSNILHDIPFLNNLIERTLALEFEEIVLIIDEHLEGVEVSEDDVAYEIRERATRAIALMEQVDVVIDDFDGQVTVYYSGVREINGSTHVVPYIQIGSPSRGHNRPHRASFAANFYLLTGIRRGSDFGFTRTEIRMSDDRIIWRNHNLEDRNELSIVPVSGGINEVATRSFSLGGGGTHRSSYPRRFEWDMDVSYNHMIRFINQDTNVNHDVILSEREISSVTTIAELFNIMSDLAVHIPEREF